MADVTTPERIRRRVRVTGTVQGVGFRPFLHRCATVQGLGGWVRNDSVGVLFEVEGRPEAVDALLRSLREDPPLLARVATVDVEALAPTGGVQFSIVASDRGGAATAPVGVDSATCPACLAEVDDPHDRRHRYPFTNCTNCGPRYTIVQSVPYDRAGTTMAGFTMCSDCQAEYDDPTNRRFHAQPNACPVCGPTLRWTVSGAAASERCTATGAHGDAALAAAVEVLRGGGIVAVKGIGGFHLAVDATDDAAVDELRRRKARDDKPFAVMVDDLDAARSLCDLSDAAAAALCSPARPVVIAARGAAHPLGGARVAAGVAPGLADLGLLLAYTPLHHLLLTGVQRPLVMTSGNLTDEPIAFEDDDAQDRLARIADGVLGHDRDIHVRCDDSVVHSTRGGVQVLRRSRGYAPQPLALPVVASRSVLALGAEMKSTVALTVGGEVVASHHIGDLEHLATYRSFVQAIDHLRRMYGITPDVVAHDLHPEYLSSKFAADLDLPTIGVQHHHAHLAACLVEHGRTAPVLGLVFDGLGYGADGELWGGELLVGDLAGFQRVGHLARVTMPGGVAAIREPWRMGVAWLRRAGFDDCFDDCFDGAFDDARFAAVARLVDRGHGPSTTSVGRLFDAVAAVLGGRSVVTYEAQAAIELEALAGAVPRSDAPILPVDVARDPAGMVVIDPSSLVAEIVVRRRAGAPRAVLAAAFHESIGRAAARAAIDASAVHGLRTVALSGGAFQNRRLADVVEETLVGAGLEVLTHRSVPPNDGGISVGQAAIAAAGP